MYCLSEMKKCFTFFLANLSKMNNIFCVYRSLCLDYNLSATECVSSMPKRFVCMILVLLFINCVHMAQLQ